MLLGFGGGGPLHASEEMDEEGTEIFYLNLTKNCQDDNSEDSEATYCHLLFFFFLLWFSIWDLSALDK